MAGLILVGAQALLVSQPCFAQGTGSEEALDEEINRIDSEAGKDAAKVEEALKNQFGVQGGNIQPLLAEKVSYGNIAAVLAASATSGKPKQDVLGLVRSGKKWGEIATAIGADLGSILAQVQEVSKKVGADATARPKRRMKFAPGT